MYTALAPRARRPAALAPRTRRPPALAPRACRPPLLCPPCLCRELAAARPVRAAQLRGFEEGGGEGRRGRGGAVGEGGAEGRYGRGGRRRAAALPAEQAGEVCCFVNHGVSRSSVPANKSY